jgi:hopanoid biosynthesis associated radical SAM protein HpnH
MTLGLEGVMISPGYSYDHAPNQEVFMGRRNSKQLFRDIFKIGKKRGSKWRFNQSSLFVDFLAGNRTYQCTPWANPTYNVFGWQKPCYLLVDEGYAKSFNELMETTDWEKYGTGINPKCDNCMAHCGYEGTAVQETVSNPLTALGVFLFGPKLDGEMAPELPVLHGGQAPGVSISVDQIGRRSSKD